MTLFRRNENAPSEDDAARRAEGYVLVALDQKPCWARGHLTYHHFRSIDTRAEAYRLFLEGPPHGRDPSIGITDLIEAKEGQRFYFIPNCIPDLSR